MKKFFVASLLATVFMTCGLQLNAASWRVNNNTASGADFVDVNAAMNDERVAEGDTLYLDPGAYITGTQNIKKRVNIVGPGYLHVDVPFICAAFKDPVDIYAYGIKIEGCTFYGGGTLFVGNVTFERNHFKQFSSMGIGNNKQVDNVTFHANFFETSCEALRGSSDINKTKNWVITNNIIKSGMNAISSDYNVGRSGISVRDLRSATITNNVIINYDSGNCCIYNVYCSTIKNNIILNHRNSDSGNCYLPDNDCIVENNLFNTSADNANMVNFQNNTFLNSSDLTLVFEANEGATEDDRYYRLCEGSPAKGAGEGGIDCGAYAGDSYVPSGLPLYYPYFTNAVIPAVTTDGKLNIKLNIKTQNE